MGGQLPLPHLPRGHPWRETESACLGDDSGHLRCGPPLPCCPAPPSMCHLSQCSPLHPRTLIPVHAAQEFSSHGLWNPSPPSCTDVKVFSEDGTCKVVEIPADMTARDLCQLLVYRSHCVDDNSWTLVEHHPHLGLERCLEDHELVVQVESTMASDSKFLFRKNYAKYEFFKNPMNFFPEQMVTLCQQSNGSQTQLLQTFLNTSSCPEVQGFLHVKELGRKSWKKLYMCLRRSGLYCSTKGSSKEPRHLQLLADLEDCSVFSLICGKKQYSAPTDFGLCLKPNKVTHEAKGLRLLCAEDEQGRACWLTAFRLLKYGPLLYQSFQVPQQRRAAHSSFSPVRSVSENSLVAMDFSGQTGRVIENPAEAQSAALEEGHAWRQKRSTRMNALGSQSPLHPSNLSTVIHRTQQWFHGKISREESHRIIKQQGLVDGLFLLRDSQSNPKAFVLTLCHHQKVKNFQILPFEEDGQVYFSLDDGNTRFSDLIQLVDFYQLNKGVLPCKLKHHCIRVAL
ncbi:Growth factor receptor-bound protein 10 [Pteropus alecto]|uniref:Growth factor receptor-bound protein 10 n=1 Tax=Pteropus alecto TaxID=9402 RepID=L5KMB2_PTEAL|nr:Growth factor receptor-bound protein 10 [Pteropus alecto]